MQGIVIHKDADTPQNNTDTLAELLSISEQWQGSKAATVARYHGILSAKTHALNDTSNLLLWGRWLSWAVIFVSAIHIWETVASISPVDILVLWAWVYYVAGLVFTVLIDTVAVFLLKSNTALAYVGGKGNKAIWFFYGVTAFLNGSFIAAHTPKMTEGLKLFLIGAYGNMFVILLPLCVPIALWAIEETNKALEACKLKLTVDCATLSGMIEGKEFTPQHDTVDNEVPVNDNVNVHPYLCVNCKAILNKGQSLASSKHGYCFHCKEAVIAERNKLSENH